MVFDKHGFVKHGLEKHVLEKLGLDELSLEKNGLDFITLSSLHIHGLEFWNYEPTHGVGFFRNMKINMLAVLDWFSILFLLKGV